MSRIRLAPTAILTTAAAALVALSVLSPAASGVQAPSTYEARVRRVLDHPKLEVAMETVDRQHDRLVADIVALTEIPAPPFKEDARAAAYLKMLRAHRLTNVERDA